MSRVVAQLLLLLQQLKYASDVITTYHSIRNSKQVKYFFGLYDVGLMIVEWVCMGVLCVFMSFFGVFFWTLK